MRPACKPWKTGEFRIEFENFCPNIQDFGISKKLMLQTLEVLEYRKHAKLTRNLNRENPISFFIVTINDFDLYAHSFMTDYSAIVEEVSLNLVNQEIAISTEITRSLDRSIAAIRPSVTS